MISSLTTSPDEPADHARAGSSCRPWPDQGEGLRIESSRAWTAFGPGRETSLSFRPHSQPGSLQAGVKSEISSFVVGFTENPSAPATLVTLLDTPAVPSRPVCCGLSRRLDTRPCELRSSLRPGLFSRAPRLLGASLPLRRYVRRVGVGTWPRGAVFPAFPVVHVCRLQKRNRIVNTKVADM